MRRTGVAIVTLVLLALISTSAPAYSRHAWTVTSPDHEQTFAYGTETHRAWTEWGRNRHLVLLLNFTNDPYVDRDNPRQYDNFSFAFPSVKLGRDGRTFYYITAGGRSIPVAQKQRDFLDIDEIKLLPNAELIVKKPHGYLTVTLAFEAL